MDQHARAVFLTTQAACMQAEMAAMQERNMRDREAKRPASHVPEDFEALCDQYGLGHNAVILYLQGDY